MIILPYDLLSWGRALNIGWWRSIMILKQIRQIQGIQKWCTIQCWYTPLPGFTGLTHLIALKYYQLESHVSQLSETKQNTQHCTILLATTVFILGGNYTNFYLVNSKSLQKKVRGEVILLCSTQWNFDRKNINTL